MGAHTSGHMCVLHGWADLELTLEILLECPSSELIQEGSDPEVLSVASPAS